MKAIISLSCFAATLGAAIVAIGTFSDPSLVPGWLVLIALLSFAGTVSLFWHILEEL